MFSFPSKIYPITDLEISGLSHAEQVARLIAGGATLIQLRDKHSSPREFFKEAQKALTVARSFGVQIIINDRVDVALALGADGVHLGQDDIPPAAARSLLGDKAVIGFSVHSVAQAKAAVEMPIDYLGIGPVFATSTKENPDPVIGIEGLQRTREVLGNVPLVAIGGITASRIAGVREAGANAVALISALLENPSEITARMKDLNHRS
jgi:thiamine-phosphate pyrophosphorylase